MAKLLAGAFVSVHAAMDAAAIAIPTIDFVLTVRILFGVRKQDTREKIDPDDARATERHLEGTLQRASLGQPSCETRSQMPQCFSHLRLHGLHRYSECARDLRVTQTLSTAQLKYFATSRRKLGDRRRQRIAELGGNQLRRAGSGNRFFADELRLGTTSDIRVSEHVQ